MTTNPSSTIEDKKTLAELLLRMKTHSPIFCVFKCEYAGIVEHGEFEANICLNPEVYAKYPEIMAVDDIILSCPFSKKRRQQQCLTKGM